MPDLEILSTDDPRLASATHLDVARQLIEAATIGAGPADDHRRAILRFLAEHRDAALRTNARGHLTGSALVVDPSSRRTLLMLHRKLGRWFQPGGHADGDTNLAAVALREAQEETGVSGLRVVVPAIDVDVHEVAPPSEPVHLHLDLRFLVLAPPGSVEHANEESLALRWVDLEGLDALVPTVDESTRRLVERGFVVLDHLGS